MEINREAKSLVTMRKRQAIGQLRLDSRERLSTQITSGFLENGFEPQPTNAQESFLASIRSIHLLSMSMRHATPASMHAPPHGQIHHKEPAMQMLTGAQATAFNEAAATLVILKGGLDSHTFSILADAFVRSLAIPDEQPCLLISCFPTRTQPAVKAMLLPQEHFSLPGLPFLLDDLLALLPLSKEVAELVPQCSTG